MAPVMLVDFPPKNDQVSIETSFRLSGRHIAMFIAPTLGFHVCEIFKFTESGFAFH